MNTLSIKTLCPQKMCLCLCFHNNITCLSVILLRISHSFSVSCKIVYWWVKANCFFMSVVSYDDDYYRCSTKNLELKVLSIRLAQAVFEPNIFPYKYPNNLILVILPAYSSYEDGTVCSETLAYKIQTPGNHPNERIQHIKILAKI